MRTQICRDEVLCTGCTACKNACPKHCISMQENHEGFLYPVIDNGKCVDCGICEKACPINHPPEIGDIFRKTYVARTIDKDILSLCTSGGIFTTLAKSFILRSGIVYGVVFDAEFNVLHSKVSNVSEIKKLCGSKYVQSNLGDIFTEIKNSLNSDQEVLFCGTPCQVAGLMKFLDRPFTKLYCVDLVCHGVPSPKIWKDYLEYLKENYGAISYINFRSKKLGYHISVMEERFKNGSIQLGSARTNLMAKCFFRNIADRMSCYDCQFKSVERCSDITLFDSWHAEKLVNGLKDDDKGYTNIIIQSTKGQKLIDKYLEDRAQLYQVDTKKAVNLDGSMALNSVRMPSDRGNFISCFNEQGLKKSIDKYLPISRKDKILEKLKIQVSKTSMLYRLKKVLK